VVFLVHSAYKRSVPEEAAFFKGLGGRIRRLREAAGYSQEDMIAHGFSVRYWQKVEAGKPITLRTLLRICRLFSTPMHKVVLGLDKERFEKRAATRKATARRRRKPTG
jgi:transcriptional regulator with XRE-family HTH domain